MSHDHSTEKHVHVTSPLLLLGVFAGLIVLTIITVACATAEKEGLIHLGPMSIWIALIIAVIKGGLVCMYFMHLRWDSPFHGMIVIISLLFVAIFIGLAVLDT